MTIGNSTLDLRYQAIPQDIDSTGKVTNLSPTTVGFYWNKVWNGTNYSSSASPKITGPYWVRAQAKSDKVIKFRKEFGEHRLPDRATFEAHPYHMSLSMWSDQLFTIKRTDKTSSTRSFQQSYGSGYSTDSSTSWNANDDLKIIDALRTKIAGSDFDLGVFLGEGHEALSMIANNATRIYRSLVDLKHGNLIGAAKHLGIVKTARYQRAYSKGKSVESDLSARWLELQYGWLPLIKDTYDGAQFLAQYLNFPYLQRYSVTRKKPLKASPSSLQLKGCYSYDGFTQVKITAYVKEVNPAALAGLTDPASVIWELTPWSFVADWFIPIGSYLQARGLASAITGTFVTSKKTDEKFFADAINGSPTFVAYNVTYKKRNIVFDRTVSSSLFVPYPNIKPLGEVLSWKHCANAVALLVQNFSSKTRTTAF